MSLAVGAASSTKIMGLDEQSNEEVSETKATEKTSPDGEEEHQHDEPKTGGISRQMSDGSVCPTEEEEEDEERKIELGPQYTLKEQLEKDKVALSLSFFPPSFSFVSFMCQFHLL